VRVTLQDGRVLALSADERRAPAPRPPDRHRPGLRGRERFEEAQREMRLYRYGDQLTRQRHRIERVARPMTVEASRPKTIRGHVDQVHANGLLVRASGGATHVIPIDRFPFLVPTGTRVLVTLARLADSSRLGPSIRHHPLTSSAVARLTLTCSCAA
jgi:hypothetical protein